MDDTVLLSHEKLGLSLLYLLNFIDHEKCFDFLSHEFSVLGDLEDKWGLVVLNINALVDLSAGALIDLSTNQVS